MNQYVNAREYLKSEALTQPAHMALANASLHPSYASVEGSDARPLLKALRVLNILKRVKIVFIYLIKNNGLQILLISVE